ncbi:hypothetical protein QQG55_33610 [Brugia pahangi]
MTAKALIFIEFQFTSIDGNFKVLSFNPAIILFSDNDQLNDAELLSLGTSKNHKSYYHFMNFQEISSLI